jgi:tol-pal system protein YbgF
VRPDAARSSALDPDAKASYEAALALVQGRQYDRGVEGLSAFLARWPDHPYAENAIYWRGEAYFAQGEYLRAGEQFEAVMARFGSGKKAPDALLKLGMCQDRLGASTRAREYWERLKTEYPKSEAAKRIPSGSRDSGAKGPKENR